MTNRRLVLYRPDVIIFAVSLVGTAILFMFLAMQVNLDNTSLAFDWKNIRQSIQKGDIQWGNGMFYNPPWALFFILPLSYLPLQAGWGFLMFLLVVVLIVSIPPCKSRWKRWGCVVLLITAYPVGRACADGNLEVFILIGVLAILIAYHRQQPRLLALGVLLATIKPQATFLFLVVAVLYLFQTWPRSDLVKAGAIVSAVVALSLWWQGRPWINTMTMANPSFNDGISMQVVWDPVVPSGLVLLFRTAVAGVSLFLAYRGNRQVSRPKAAMLIAASMLTAPYSQPLALILLLVLGVVPLTLWKPPIGLSLFALYAFPYLQFMGLNVDLLQNDPFWHIMLALTWITLMFYVYVIDNTRLDTGEYARQT